MMSGEVLYMHNLVGQLCICQVAVDDRTAYNDA